ncbi:hypothetical protein LguiA_030055 [Lonicera macranthoides]
MDFVPTRASSFQSFHFFCFPLAAIKAIKGDTKKDICQTMKNGTLHEKSGKITLAEATVTDHLTQRRIINIVIIQSVEL